MTQRDPGPEIKSRLRKEVNFGCPVRFPDGAGCGSPILTYHHFDPPWAGNKVHNFDGMIALCPEHHGQADGGAWTNKQLVDFKKNPYVDRRVRVRWPWNTEKMLVRAGPNIVINSGGPLYLRQNPILKFGRTETTILDTSVVNFSSKILNKNNETWIEISEGFFDLDLSSCKTHDVVFKPNRRSAEAKHADGTSFLVQMNRVRATEFERWWRDLDRKNRFGPSKSITEKYDVIDSDGKIPIVTVKGNFTTADVGVTITERTMRFSVGGSVFSAPQEFNSSGHIVDNEHYMELVDQNKKPLFRIG